MLTPLSLLEQQISRTDQQLLFHMVVQQMETNRLLTQLIGVKPTQEAEAVNIDVLKRPELMKRIGKTKAPQGWQKWSNDKMVEYLKGAN